MGSQTIGATLYLLCARQWCGHCKKLAPEYVQAAAMLRQDAHPTYIGKVDATENSGLAALYGVKGYPTLKVHGFTHTHVLCLSRL